MKRTTLLSFFHKRAEKSIKTIGIGLSPSYNRSLQMIRDIQKNLFSFPGKIIFIGKKPVIEELQREITDLQTSSSIEITIANEPEQFLLNHLQNPKNSTDARSDGPHFDVIIRGGLSSSSFLKRLSRFQTNLYGNPMPTQRLALLETAGGQQFFYAGVGIDEINSYHQKSQFIENTIQFLTDLQITPKIGILSGGRLSDLGRDITIDKNIQQASKLEIKIQSKYPNVHIKHYEILIEQAITNHVNVLIAPEGVAGNLVYRTLIHLGKGKSYGAIYLNHFLHSRQIIIDCSRVAPAFELVGSIYFGAGISFNKKKVF